MSKTTEQLILQVRKIIVGDLDLPQDDPDTEITDAELLSYLNDAQDELSRFARLQAVNVAFTCTGGVQFNLDDSSKFSNQRFDEIQTLWIGGSKQNLQPLDDWNPALTTGVFVAGDAILILGSGAITGVASGNILAPTLIALSTCGLPASLADFHLARYAVSMWASSLSMDNQTQITKITTFKAQAEDAAKRYARRQRQSRFPNTNQGLSYRV